MKTFLVVLLVALIAACSAPYVQICLQLLEQEKKQQSLPHRPEAQSWDQGNLSRLAHRGSGKLCPEAVFSAPGGVLEQCN